MDFFRRLLMALLALPQEVLAALWRIILLLILLLLILLRWLIQILTGKKPDKPDRPRCNKVPEHIKRKPDPCLYSQSYRMSQRSSVTWDNPDIWITLPDGTPVDSSSLAPDTDYLVHVRISDASFDPALSTEVRCFYRPWSFNSPDTTPVETNPDGTEKVEVLHITPWGSEVAEFRWKTPDAAGHYCLQAECRHADDINTANNMGQENTNIVEGNAGETKSAKAFLFNDAREERKFRIFADRFTIPEGEMTLRLKTLSKPFIKNMGFDSLRRSLLTYDAKDSKLRTYASREPQLIRYAYTGWEELKKKVARGQFTIGPEWDLKVDGKALEDGWTEVDLAAQEGRAVVLDFQIPDDAEPGSKYHFNFTATNHLGKTLGGVTIEIRVNN